MWSTYFLCLFVVLITVTSSVYASDDDTEDQPTEEQDSEEQHLEEQQDSCPNFQTQFIEEDDGETVCFTSRPLPVCRESCQAGETIMKAVMVHCVPRSRESDLWKKQIQAGASLDIRDKSATKSLLFEVAESCSP